VQHITEGDGAKAVAWALLPTVVVLGLVYLSWRGRLGVEGLLEWAIAGGSSS